MIFFFFFLATAYVSCKFMKDATLVVRGAPCLSRPSCFHRWGGTPPPVARVVQLGDVSSPSLVVAALSTQVVLEAMGVAISEVVLIDSSHPCLS